jgi:hypothetical protein
MYLTHMIMWIQFMKGDTTEAIELFYFISIIWYRSLRSAIASQSERFMEVQWLRLALSKGPNWVRVFHSPLTWRRKQIQFPKCCFLVPRIPDDGQSPKTQWFWVLYHIVRTLENLFDLRRPCSRTTMAVQLNEMGKFVTLNPKCISC